MRFLGIVMSKSARIRIAKTRGSVYQVRLAEGKLLIMPSAKESLVGCTGVGFMGRPMRTHANGSLGLPLRRRFNIK